MLHAIIAGALRQRLILLVVAAVLVGFGIHAAQQLSVDAFPDVTNIQVQIATEAPGKSPEEVERFVTIPIEIAMTGLPGMTDMRSLNKPGLSLITLVFTDESNLYRERQMISERLAEVRDRMPPGVTPVLGPITNALGEVYQYTLEEPGESAGKHPLTHEELVERRTLQDWVVRPLLRSIPGVAEINSTGGYVKQYETLVDPQRLHYYDLTINDVRDAMARNNANAGGGILPQHAEQYLIRSVGLVRNLDDIRNIVLKEDKGTPIYIRDVAQVTMGTEVRYGAMIKNGYTEAVGGVVLMTSGGNAKEIVSRVKERVAEINSRHMIPNGLQIVPYYDRSQLVDAAIHTVTEVLAEGVLFVVVILYLFLGDVRSSLIVSANLLLTPLLTFLVMNHIGLSANLMSLGGLAIAIGLMVDGSVVVVENVFAKLSHARHEHHPQDRFARLHVILAAVQEVATPTHLRCGHHHSRLPAVDDARGHGRKDVCPSRVHDRDCAGHLFDSFTHALSRIVVVPAQRRLRRGHLVASPSSQALQQNPALGDAPPKSDGACSYPRLLWVVVSLSIPGYLFHPGDAGGYALPQRRSSAKHLARRISEDGEGDAAADASGSWS